MICLPLGVRGMHTCTRAHTQLEAATSLPTQTYTHTPGVAAWAWLPGPGPGRRHRCPHPLSASTGPRGTYLCAGFHRLIQPLPRGLDATPLCLNLGRAPGYCPFQGVCPLPQGLDPSLPQALDILSESIELLFQQLQDTGPGRSFWRWCPATLKADEGLGSICHF